VWTGFNWITSVADSCEHCNESSGPIMEGELFDQLTDCQFLKDSTRWT